MFANLAHRKETNGVLAHLVERNTGSVEVSGSSPLCATQEGTYSDASSRNMCFSIFAQVELHQMSTYMFAFLLIENTLVTNATSPFIAIKVEKENDIEK